MSHYYQSIHKQFLLQSAKSQSQGGGNVGEMTSFDGKSGSDMDECRAYVTETLLVPGGRRQRKGNSDCLGLSLFQCKLVMAIFELFKGKGGERPCMCWCMGKSLKVLGKQEIREGLTSRK